MQFIIYSYYSYIVCAWESTCQVYQTSSFSYVSRYMIFDMNTVTANASFKRNFYDFLCVGLQTEVLFDVSVHIAKYELNGFTKHIMIEWMNALDDRRGKLSKT